MFRLTIRDRPWTRAGARLPADLVDRAPVLIKAGAVPDLDPVRACRATLSRTKISLPPLLPP
jgi:hypothetical protein